MNILVTGANGQLGNEMRIVARDSADRYIFTDVTQQEGVETTFLDITDLDAIRAMVRENSVGAIVNCAAWTNVDTDYVFGKEPYNTPCRPDQQGTPTGVYGETKKMGEERIMEVWTPQPPLGGEMVNGQWSMVNGEAGGFIIIRTAWLYSEFGKNFCKTMLQLTATKPQLKVVFDQCGTPTYALDLARAIQVILQKPVQGIYHYSNEGVCSWYDFTQMIARIAGHKDCDIQPCLSSEYPSPVKRPAYSVLDKRSIRETFGIKVPYWVDSLEKCIKNILSEKRS